MIDRTKIEKPAFARLGELFLKEILPYIVIIGLVGGILLGIIWGFVKLGRSMRDSMKPVTSEIQNIDKIIAVDEKHYDVIVTQGHKSSIQHVGTHLGQRYEFNVHYLVGLEKGEKNWANVVDDPRKGVTVIFHVGSPDDFAKLPDKSKPAYDQIPE